MDQHPILTIDDLRVYFSSRVGAVKAVDGVDLTIRSGETLGLVGESGSGKSVTARAIMRLVPTPPGEIAGGSIEFDGVRLLDLPEKQMRSLRGDRISMIFQDPMTFLNPVYTAGEQVAEAIRLHQGASRGEARTRTVELFRTVGIPSPEERFSQYPHELSGGMRQRVMIAIALSSNPELLIADEPTTALDVTIQAQILDLLRDLQSQFSMSILLITHDLGVVAEMCDRVAVMYSGRVVEQAPVETLFAHPEHPYTIGLMKAVPRPEIAGFAPQPIAGSPPNPATLPVGCRFAPRCRYAADICRDQDPVLRPVGKAHVSACHFAGDGRFSGELEALSTSTSGVPS